MLIERRKCSQIFIRRVQVDSPTLHLRVALCYKHMIEIGDGRNASYRASRYRTSGFYLQRIEVPGLQGATYLAQQRKYQASIGSREYEIFN